MVTDVKTPNAASIGELYEGLEEACMEAEMEGCCAER